VLFGHISCTNKKEAPGETATAKEQPERKAEPMRSQGNERKIVFIGIDAADWEILTPLIEQGKMPNLEQIVENGAWGRLESFGRTLSPIIWTTIATGKMPEKHGIVSFVVKDRDSSETRPIDSTYRKTKAIWNMFSDFGIKVGIIDWQVSFPPEEVNGYIIANVMVNEKNKSYPPEIQRYFEEEVFLRRRYQGEDETKWDRIIGKQEYALNYVEQVGLSMQRKHDVDFFAIYTHAIDVIQHQFWRFRAPELFQDSRWNLSNGEVAKYGDVIDDFNIASDQLIGNLIKDGHTIMVVSDHGSVPWPRIRTLFEFNRLLKIMGLLTFSDATKNEVDFSSTRVYAGGFERWYRNIGVSIVLQGREPNGIVTQDEYEEMIERLIKELSAITFVETGGPIFTQVVRFADFKGKDNLVAQVDIIVEQAVKLMFGAPDLHITVEGKVYQLNDFFGPSDGTSGQHAMHGIIAVMGEGIKPGRIDGAKVVDVTPTILYMMGIPVGKDMDGYVIKEMFVEEYLKENPIRYVESYDAIGEKLAQEEEERGTSTANDEIKAKLRALGYIE
jgi:predicted AlkP superfamily phosphohydrolase/phosphomutase